MAIIGIVLGSICVLVHVYGITTAASVASEKTGGSLDVASIPAWPHLASIWIVQEAIGFWFAIVLLFGSIFALKLRPAARATILVWAMTAMAWSAGSAVMEIKGIPSVFSTSPKMESSTSPAPVSWPATAAPTSVFICVYYPEPPTWEKPTLPGLIGRATLRCIMPVLFLTLWTRRKVKTVFEAI